MNYCTFSSTSRFLCFNKNHHHDRGFCYAVQNSKDGLNIWGILFGILAVLFNPVIPVYLHDKGAWMVIDIIAIIIFICYIKKSKTNEKH